MAGGRTASARKCHRHAHTQSTASCDNLTCRDVREGAVCAIVLFVLISFCLIKLQSTS